MKTEYKHIKFELAPVGMNGLEQYFCNEKRTGTFLGSIRYYTNDLKYYCFHPSEFVFLNEDHLHEILCFIDQLNMETSYEDRK